MKLLILCDQGNNRSVQFAHLLKYWGNDCIAAGTETNSKETLKMLCNWADKIILTSHLIEGGVIELGSQPVGKIVVFDVGPDTYPRPFNPVLHAMAKHILEANKSWLKDGNTQTEKSS